MAITSWDSENLDWDNIQGRMLWPYMEAIRLALRERSLVLFGSDPTVEFLKSYPAMWWNAKGVTYADIGRLELNLDAVFDALPTTDDYFNTIRSTATRFFIDQTDTNFGNWDGTTSVPKVWTLANLLSHLGYADYYSFNYTDPGGTPGLGDGARSVPFYAWAKQKKEMLDLLRYTCQEVANTSTGYRASSNHATWQDAVDYFEDTAAWSALTNGPAARILGRVEPYLGVPNPRYRVNRYRRSSTVTPATAEFDHVVDLYVRADSLAIGSANYTVYDNQDYTVDEGDHLLFQQFTTPGSSARSYSIGDFDVINMDEPIYYSGSSTQNGWQSGRLFAVWDWTCTGGLQFIVPD
jgi:hypothetical protein